MKFPVHAASLTLTHNDHKNYYSTVKRAIDEKDHGYSASDFISEEEMKKAIETDDCWMLQWYPSTPVGFCILSAHSLDALLEAATEPEFQGG